MTTDNPWPKFEPHPDDAAYCYRCGLREGLHGADVNHCPPAVLAADDVRGSERPSFERCKRILDAISDIVKLDPGRHSVYHLPELVADLKRRADAHSPLDLPSLAQKKIESLIEVFLRVDANTRSEEIERTKVMLLYVLSERIGKGNSASMLSSLMSFAALGLGKRPPEPTR